MDKIIGIYKITNKINGKSYIGQSVNVYKRFAYHKTRCQNKYLYASIQKYGLDNFTFEIIKQISDSKLRNVLLDVYEEYYINLYKTLDRNYGYNRMHGGQPGRLCEESKQLMMLNSAGKLIGYKHTDMAIKNMSLAQSNRSQEWRQRLSESQKNKIVSESTKEKIRLARQNQSISEETKSKLSKALTGRKKSPEHIARVRESFQRFLQTEEGIAYKKALSDKMKNRTISQSTRDKMSKAKKKKLS